MCLDVFNRKIYRPAQFDWPWHFIDTRHMAVAPVPVRLNEYRDVMSGFRSSCVLSRRAEVGVVHTIAPVLLVAYTPSEYILTIKPAATAAAFIVVLHYLSLYQYKRHMVLLCASHYLRILRLTLRDLFPATAGTFRNIYLVSSDSILIVNVTLFSLCASITVFTSRMMILPTS